MTQLHEFYKWPKISRFCDATMSITQKLDGTNGQLFFTIDEDTGEISLSVGSRNRWLTVEDDNHGFCAWAHANKKKLFTLLGVGRHYGEWCGPGIQNGEGLTERKFFIFDTTKAIIPNDLVQTVPELYRGPFSESGIDNALEYLQTYGSLVNGFNKPEGIIITINGGFRLKIHLRSKE